MSAGLPQLDFTTYPSQLFWLAISFVVLYWFISRFAVPSAEAIFASRKTRIDADLLLAEQLQAEAANKKAIYEKALHDARSSALKVILENETKVTREINERSKTLESDVNKRLAAADKKIQQFKDEAQAKIAPIAQSTTEELMRKLAGLDVSPRDVAKIIESS